jgi:hypothetical protein
MSKTVLASGFAVSEIGFCFSLQAEYKFCVQQTHSDSSILNVLAVANVLNSIHFVVVLNRETSFRVCIHLCPIRFSMEVAGNSIFDIDLITFCIV